MKQCSKCQEVKSETEFYQKTKTRKQSYCKPCFNRYCMDRWIIKKIKFVKSMGGKCEDCDYSYTGENLAVFEFHHLDSNKKEFEWDKLRQKGDIKIKKELDNCALLCANCHRMRHVVLFKMKQDV